MKRALLALLVASMFGCAPCGEWEKAGADSNKLVEKYRAENDSLKVIILQVAQLRKDKDSLYWECKRLTKLRFVDPFNLGWWLEKSGRSQEWLVIHSNRDKFSNGPYYAGASLIPLWEEAVNLRLELIRKGGPSE